MKDSGVDWLGEIPAHWEATQLKRTWAICEYGISESLSGEGDIRVLTMGNIQDGRVTLPSAGCLENILENMLLNDGDLLFNRTNSLAHVGKVGLYRPDGKGPVSFASYLVRIRPNSRTIPEFMTYLLNIPQLLSFARGLALPSINQANLNPTRYGQIHVALPPIQEQHMIVEYVDRVASKVDRLTSEVEIAVNRLTEYRQALITSAVTGKIDVRGWQAELEAA
jgi:type I restriction enzyme S subunit